MHDMADDKRKSSRHYDLSKKSTRHYDLSKPTTRSFNLEKEGEMEAFVTGSTGSPIVSPDPSSKKSIRKIATVLGIVAFVLAIGLIWHFVGGRDGENKEEVAQNAAEMSTSNQEVSEEIALATAAGTTIGEESVDEETTEEVSEDDIEQIVSDETNGLVSSSEGPITGSTTGIATDESNNAGITENATTSGQSSMGEPSGVASKPVGQTSSTSETTKVGSPYTNPAGQASTLSETNVGTSNPRPDSNFNVGKAASVSHRSTTETSGLGMPIISKAEQVALWDALDDQVKEVILGVYGNGKAREEALGDSYENIQTKVNEYYYAKYGK